VCPVVVTMTPSSRRQTPLGPLNPVGLWAIVEVTLTVVPAGCKFGRVGSFRADVDHRCLDVDIDQLRMHKLLIFVVGLLCFACHPLRKWTSSRIACSLVPTPISVSHFVVCLFALIVQSMNSLDHRPRRHTWKRLVQRLQPRLRWMGDQTVYPAVIF
jgi:hypothetical protein